MSETFARDRDVMSRPSQRREVCMRTWVYVTDSIVQCLLDVLLPIQSSDFRIYILYIYDVML